MTDFPDRPKVSKGALVQLGTTSLPRAIAFQYNPDSLTRTLISQTEKLGGDPETVYNLRGAPRQKITMNIRIDASDQLNDGNTLAESLGIYSQLAALELLICPPTEHVIAQAAILATGATEIIAPTPPMTVLVWGKKRILPVRLESYTILEEMHDANLNPIQARVSLVLQVLTYSDFSILQPGYHLSLVNQIEMEALAATSYITTFSEAIGFNPDFGG